MSPVAELDTAVETVSRWRSDPIFFLETVLGIQRHTMIPQTVQIMEALRDHDRVAVAACHASTKTFTASCAAWWWACSFQPSKVITTAPTARQVKSLLWAEIRARHANAAIPLPGDVQTTFWQMPDQPDWFMIGFSTRPEMAEDGATRFHGYHSPNILVIFDEAAGVVPKIWQAAEGLMSAGHAKFLAIGNPTDPTGAFAEAYRSPEWHSIRINAYDTPNVQRQEQVFPWCVSHEWVEHMRKTCGEDSPIFKAKVLGLFPDSAEDTLIPMAWMQLAFDRPALVETDDPVSLGVDVARFGSDFTCFYAVRGSEIVHASAVNGKDLMWTSGRVIDLAGELGIPKADARLIAIDDTGVGGGVTDRLRELGWNVNPENFGSKPHDVEQFANRRTELWCALREWIRDDACLETAPHRAREMLEADLSTPKYVFKSDGRRQLESKADMKKRLGRSPDDGDALALALAHRTAVPAISSGMDDDDDAPIRRWGFDITGRAGGRPERRFGDGR